MKRGAAQQEIISGMRIDITLQGPLRFCHQAWGRSVTCHLWSDRAVHAGGGDARPPPSLAALRKEDCRAVMRERSSSSSGAAAALSRVVCCSGWEGTPAGHGGSAVLVRDL